MATAYIRYLKNNDNQIVVPVTSTRAVIRQGADGKTSSTLEKALRTIETNVAGKAPIAHAVAATTYGVGSTANFGHLKITDALGGGNAAAGVAISSTGAQTAINTRAPTAHAVAAATYGAGNATLLGHVKLSDAVDGTNLTAAAGQTAATPKAVATAYTAIDTHSKNGTHYKMELVGTTLTITKVTA